MSRGKSLSRMRIISQRVRASSFVASVLKPARGRTPASNGRWRTCYPRSTRLQFLDRCSMSPQTPNGNKRSLCLRPSAVPVIARARAADIASRRMDPRAQLESSLSPSGQGSPVLSFYARQTPAKQAPLEQSRVESHSDPAPLVPVQNLPYESRIDKSSRCLDRKRSPMQPTDVSVRCYEHAGAMARSLNAANWIHGEP